MNPLYAAYHTDINIRAHLVIDFTTKRIAYYAFVLIAALGYTSFNVIKAVVATIITRVLRVVVRLHFNNRLLT